MNIENFKELPFSKKLEHVFSKGVFLTCRTTKECMVELFAVSEFFVEVWYSGMKNEDYIHLQLKSFRSISLVEPYLQEETSFLILKELQNTTSL